MIRCQNYTIFKKNNTYFLIKMYNIILVLTSVDSNISYSSLENEVELYIPASWKLNVAMFWPNKCKQRW